MFNFSISAMGKRTIQLLKLLQYETAVYVLLQKLVW